jgi:hypothetical protein
VEREGVRPSLHRLLGEAVARSAWLQEQSRAALDDIRESTAALERTVAAIHRDRTARRAFGNRPFDAEDGPGPG